MVEDQATKHEEVIEPGGFKFIKQPGSCLPVIIFKTAPCTRSLEIIRIDRHH